MDTDNIFTLSLVASFAVHAVILSQNPNLSLFSFERNEPRIELKYIPSPKTKPLPSKRPPAMQKSDPFLKLPPKVTMDPVAPAPYQNRNKLLMPQKMIVSQAKLAKPSLTKPDIITVKKKVSLPSIKPSDDITKINNPSYVNYYQMVREKIRRAAYQNYTHNRTGELYITFLVANDGHVKDIKLMQERSSADSYLRDIGLRSIKDASPFPNFPKELDYAELSFNVVISFEIE